MGDRDINWCRWKDTIINSASDTIYSVYFTYIKNKQLLFAKVTVLGDSALINSMDTKKESEQEIGSTKAGVWGRGKSKINLVCIANYIYIYIVNQIF
jgi:hypothetical protein